MEKSGQVEDEVGEGDLECKTLAQSGSHDTEAFANLIVKVEHNS